MNENDYIAEYVREKYPSILGVDFAFWKFKRLIAQAANDIIGVFRAIPPEEIKKAMQEDKEMEGNEDERSDENSNRSM